MANPSGPASRQLWGKLARRRWQAPIQKPRLPQVQVETRATGVEREAAEGRVQEHLGAQVGRALSQGGAASWPCCCARCEGRGTWECQRSSRRGLGGSEDAWGQLPGPFAAQPLEQPPPTAHVQMDASLPTALMQWQATQVQQPGSAQFGGQEHAPACVS